MDIITGGGLLLLGVILGVGWIFVKIQQFFQRRQK
jgi:hypothetical protein